MGKNNILLYILLLVVLTVFVYGMIHLLILRYETGDVYPPYSSLRSDPLGTKAFYEGIDNVQGLASSRNYQPAVKLKHLRNTTLFSLGMSPTSLFYLDKETVKAIEALLLQGNRLIFSFYPVYRKPSSIWLGEEEQQEAEKEKKEEEKEQENEEGEEQEKEKQTDESYFEQPISLAEQWGFDVDYTTLPVNEDNVHQAIQAFRQSNNPLPMSLSWHTSLYFDMLDKGEWKIVYVADGHPVIIERKFGQGTIVLSADSYFLSNEAMRGERHPELLTWLIGENPEVVFDETHFGIVETPGIASLIRKYRLGWFVAGVVLLAILFVWKNSLSFVPPYEDVQTSGGEMGKDILAGLVNLLRQNVSSREVVSVCFEEWKKSFSHRQKELDNTFEELHSVIDAEKARPARERNPVECYKTISKILAGR